MNNTGILTWKTVTAGGLSFIGIIIVLKLNEEQITQVLNHAIDAFAK